MYASFFGLWAWRTYGKWLDNIDDQERGICLTEDSPLDLQNRFYRQQLGKYYSRLLGKSSKQRLHEASLKMYQTMLENSTTVGQREYAEAEIQAHTRRLEEATEEFQRELEAEKEVRLI